MTKAVSLSVAFGLTEPAKSYGSDGYVLSAQLTLCQSRGIRDDAYAIFVVHGFAVDASRQVAVWGRWELSPGELIRVWGTGAPPRDPNPPIWRGVGPLASIDEVPPIASVCGPIDATRTGTLGVHVSIPNQGIALTTTPIIGAVDVAVRIQSGQLTLDVAGETSSDRLFWGRANLAEGEQAHIVVASSSDNGCPPPWSGRGFSPEQREELPLR